MKVQRGRVIGRGRARWQAAFGAAVSVALAVGLMGATTSAFAEGEPGSFETTTDPSDQEGMPDQGDAPGTEGDELTGSAFKLGDVTIACTAQENPAGSLEMGVAADRVYVLTNEGERAYVRLASALLFGDLEQPSEIAVTETAVDGSQAEDEKDEGAAVAEGESGGSEAASAWRLAGDGWWYRSEPLEPGESIEVHITVEIPFEEEWVEALSTGAPSNITEGLSVEAVQARNTSIDLDAERPWGALMVGPSPEGPSDEGTPDIEDPSDAEGPSEEASEA